MVGDSGLLLEGLLGSSGLIVSPTAPAAIRRMAERARATYGDLIQVCRATDYASKLATLVSALPTVRERQPLLAVIVDDGSTRTWETDDARWQRRHDRTCRWLPSPQPTA